MTRRRPRGGTIDRDAAKGWRELPGRPRGFIGLAPDADASHLDEWARFVETGVLSPFTNLPLVWYVPEPLDQAEVERLLDEVVPDLLRDALNEKTIPGWHVMLRLGLTFKQRGDARFATVPDARIADLLKLAETDGAAHDAACWIAAAHLNARAKMPPALRRFAVDVLAGRAARPKVKGRPRAGDTRLRLLQFWLCKLVAFEAEIPLGEGEKKSDRHTFNACRMVAEAFQRAGKYTTPEQLYALCCNVEYEGLRKLAEALGLLDRAETLNLAGFIRLRSRGTG